MSQKNSAAKPRLSTASLPRYISDPSAAEFVATQRATLLDLDENLRRQIMTDTDVPGVE